METANGAIVSITVNDREVTEMVKRLTRKMSDMSPVMHRIGALYEARVVENFKNESAPDGTPWERLSQTTVMMGLSKRGGFTKKGGLSKKGKKYLTGKRVLWDTGDLAGSVHFQADSHGVTIGTAANIPYAAVHQFGTDKAGRGNKTKIPARPYLAMNRGESLELAERDRRWIVDLIRDEIGR